MEIIMSVIACISWFGMIISLGYSKKYVNRYVVTQIIHSDTTYSKVENDTIYNVMLVSRFVIANSREEAIGKFIEDTKNIKAIKKLNIDCYKILEHDALK
jgi:hypothetical protein